MTNARKLTGEAGEHFARAFLERKGMLHVGSNWRCAAGEIDLVMVDGDMLVFVEVKTRRTNIAGTAEESVSEAKAARLLSAGEWYVSDHPEFEARTWRIDLVAITMDRYEGIVRISHFENAIASG
ncbi:YraN family protein [soil metagenome]